MSLTFFVSFHFLIHQKTLLLYPSQNHNVSHLYPHPHPNSKSITLPIFIPLCKKLTSQCSLVRTSRRRPRFPIRKNRKRFRVWHGGRRDRKEREEEESLFGEGREGLSWLAASGSLGLDEASQPVSHRKPTSTIYILLTNSVKRRAKRNFIIIFPCPPVRRLTRYFFILIFASDALGTRWRALC